MTGDKDWRVDMERLDCCCYSGYFDMLGHVTLHVQCQVVAPRKASVADFTLERLCASVLAIVSGQLVRPAIG